METLKRDWRKAALAVVLTLGLLIPSFYFAAQGRAPANAPLVPGGKLTTTLNVQVFGADGKLKGERVKVDDLLLDNFRNWFSKQFDSVNSETVVLKDTSNADRTFKVIFASSSYANTWIDCSTGTENKGGCVAIGSGTTAPTQSNYNIETIYGSWVYLTGTYPTWDASTGNLVISNSFAITSGVTISEGALAVNWVPSSGTTQYKIVMFRDTFTGIACVAGDTCVYTLTINLSASYNRNFGIYLSGMFRSVADGSSNTVNLYDTAGSSRQMYVYSGGNTNCIIAFTNENTYRTYLRHGTGSTAESRTTNDLTTPVDNEFNVITSVTVSGSDIIVVGDILCGSNRALRETGLFITGMGSASYKFLMFRCLYNQVDIVSAHSARHTLTFDW